MRARTITTIVVLGALAIPVSASAESVESDYATPNAITGGSSDSSQPVGDSDYSSVNAITGASNESSQPGGSQDVGSGYSSLNAITGPTDEPTFVSGPPPDTADGFDWASAGIGAGAAMALVALGGAALLTVRRRTAVSTASMN